MAETNEGNAIRPQPQDKRSNLIRAIEEAPALSAAAGPASSPAPSPTPKKRASLYIPETVSEAYAKVGRRHYHFSDGERAFTVRDQTLSTKTENKEVIEAMIEVMRENDVRRVHISGSERFRSRAWVMATAAGLLVDGHTPQRFERAMATSISNAQSAALPVATRAQSDAPPAMTSGTSQVPSSKGQIDSTLTVGRLVEHGMAREHHQPQGRPSYYVTLETKEGEKTFWSPQLADAISKSTTQPREGNTVGVRQLPPPESAMDPQAVLRGDTSARGSSGTRWLVEKSEFFSTRAAAAKMLRDPDVPNDIGAAQYPILAGAYDFLSTAASAARRDIPDEQVRRRFVGQMREHLAERVERGDPMPAVVDSRITRKTALREAMTLIRDERTH